jgi:hypothetical protein
MYTQKVLLLTFRSIENGPRVIRAVQSLSPSYELTVVASGKPTFEHSFKFVHSNLIARSILDKVVNKIRRDFFKKVQPSYFLINTQKKRLEKLIMQEKPSVVITHDCDILDILSSIKDKYKFKLVFNAHEYFPLEFEELKDWSTTWQPYYEQLYARALPKVDLFINICDMIREKCLSMFGIDSVVIPNASNFYQASAKPRQQGSPIRIVHHGAAIRARYLELMLQTMEHLGPNYTLDLMLMPTDTKYFEEIKVKVDRLTNVKIIPPVGFNEIIPKLTHYDIGLIFVPGRTFNYRAGLGNKFYEYVQARICLAVGPLQEMVAIVNKYEIGVATSTFEPLEMANAISGLKEERLIELKKNCDKAAQDLAYEGYDNLFKAEIAELLRN